MRNGIERLRKVVWFGNSGTPYGDFGISNLRIAEPGLRAAARLVPFELVVISNDRAKFEAVTRDYPFPCRYVPWSRKATFAEMEHADLCIVPNSRDRFSLGKSANRIVLALNTGTPVVASKVPAAEALAPFVTFDDWKGGVCDALLDPAKAKARAEASRAFIQQHYSPEAVANAWFRRLIRPSPARRLDVARAREPSGRALVFIDAVEELTLLEALANDLASAAGLEVVVGVTTEFAARTPESVMLIDAMAVEMRLFDRRALFRRREALESFDVVLALGGSHDESRAAEALVLAARAKGLVTVELQRSLLQTQPGSSWKPASEHVLTWTEPSADASSAGRRLVARRPRRAIVPLDGLDFGEGRLIAVFENLHGPLYDEPARQAFVGHLSAAAAARPEHRFVVRSHPSGKWLVKQVRAGLELPDNVLVLEPNDPAWAKVTAQGLIGLAERSITTPSTILLDAAELRRPIVATALEVVDCAPLPRLGSVEDWLAWIDGKVAMQPRDLEEFERCVSRTDAPTVGRRVAEILGRVPVEAQLPRA
jgi:hypothetical protein